MYQRQLPPGQRALDRFPRFGTHLHKPPPPVPARPVITVAGAVEERFDMPLEDVAALGRREMTADFHCVAGWSATGLRWRGVPFRLFWDRVVQPRLRPGTRATHVVFGGLDGYRAVAEIDDALQDDVLIADGLDGRSLDADHGAPVRLVSPRQYGFVSTKHLCLVEVHTSAPDEGFGSSWRVSRMLMRPPLFARHPRSRVWEEERNAVLPARLVRPIYRALTPPIGFLSARGSASAARARDRRPGDGA